MRRVQSDINRRTGDPAKRFGRWRTWAGLVVFLLVGHWVLAQDQSGGLHVGGTVTSGSAQFGARQVTIGGNQEVYHSQVNLGSGIRLLNLFVESRSPENRGPIYDFLSYSMNSWGGDPYNTIRLRLERHHLYRFDFNYWRMDFVSLLPTFANPLLESGLEVSEHSFDQARRSQSYKLTLFPDTRFQLRLGYDRNHSFGLATTTFASGLDEFVLNDPVRTITNDYHLGVDVRLGRLDLTLEQDFRTFKDDIATSQPGGLPNLGNDPIPGPVGATVPQQILLTSFNRNNAVRAFIPATRLALHSHLAENLLVTGRFVYSDSDIDFNRDEILSGSLFDLTALSFITRQSSSTLAAASKPNTLTDVSVNYRPLRRLVLTNSTRFSHFVIAGSSLLSTLQTLGADFLGNPPPPEQAQRQLSFFLNERTFLNSFRNQFLASYDLLPQLTLRGGYRFTHRRAVLDIPAPLRGTDRSTLNTQTGIAGLSFRAARNFRLLTQFERGSADNVFTRIASRDITRVRLRSSVQPLEKLRLNGQYLLTDSRNPNPLVDNIQRNRVFNLSSSWFPQDRFSLDVGYTRTDISSFTDIINPRTLTTERSIYIANDNVVDADLSFSPLPGAQVSVGYSLINSQGTFPLNFHRPRARISYSFPSHLTWSAAWQWYGYNEKGVAIQDYRAHLVTTSLEITF